VATQRAERPALRSSLSEQSLKSTAQIFISRHENASPSGKIRRFETKIGDLRESARRRLWDWSGTRSKCEVVLFAINIFDGTCRVSANQRQDVLKFGG